MSNPKTRETLGTKPILPSRNSIALVTFESFELLFYNVVHFVKFQFCPIWGPPLEQDISVIKGSGDRIATWMFYVS